MKRAGDAIRSLPASLAEFRAFVLDFTSIAGRRLVVAFLLVLAGTAAEAVGLLALVPIVDAGAADDGRSTAGVVRWVGSVFDGFGSPGGIEWAVAIALVFGGSMIARALLALYRDVRLTEIETGFMATKLTTMVDRVATARWQVVSGLRHARVTHVFTNDVYKVGRAAVNLVNVAVATLTLAAHFLLALLVSPLLTLAAAVMLAVAAVLSMTLFKAARELAEYATSTQLALLDDTAQFLGAMKLAISQNLQHRFVADFARDMRRLVAQEVAFYEASGRVELRLAILAATVAAATIVVGVGILEVPVGELVLVVVLFARMNGPARKLQSSILEIVRALPAYRQLDDLDRHLAAATADAPEGGNVPGRGPIRFSGVTYRHADGEAVAGVRDLDLEIREGEFLGIAGRSGAGKTTFVDLLVGLYEPQAGGITVAGQPFQPARSSAWRDGIGYVAQDPFLRNDTVRANLLWVAPEATDAEIASVLALSGADLVVARLPQGLETVVGERGGLVSGGERQRIAIARALLRRPRLLILDEATNAIDIAGEHGLLSALRSLLPTTTIVTIAHRAESLALCDRIVVLRGGRVVDEGDYGQLRGRLVSLEQEDSG